VSALRGRGRRRARAALALAVAAVLAVGCTGVPDGVEPVRDFDLDRYLGTWFEIARLDHRFERGLTDVSATYTRREDGGVDVRNRGYDPEAGAWQEAIGRAYPIGEPGRGSLKVSFFGPFYAGYHVIALDRADYRYALVTGPDRGYLWILARERTLAPERLDVLLRIAQDHGYDVDALIFVDHTRDDPALPSPPSRAGGRRGS